MKRGKRSHLAVGTSRLLLRLTRQTHTETGRQRETDRQTDRQTDTERHREREVIHLVVVSLCYGLPLTQQSNQSPMTLLYQLWKCIQHFTVNEVYKPCTPVRHIHMSHTHTHQCDIITCHTLSQQSNQSPMTLLYQLWKCIQHFTVNEVYKPCTPVRHIHMSHTHISVT